MSVYKGDYKTKDGRCWKFRCQYYDIKGDKKPYKSGNYATKKEAEQAEKEFVKKQENICKEINSKITTLGELRDDMIKYKKCNVRQGTFDNYKYKLDYLKGIEDIKIENFTYQDYLKWREELLKKDYKVGYKNDINKHLKTVMNYGTKYHDMNFSKILSKAEKIKDPNAIKVEREIWTIKEFEKFIAVVDNDILKVMYKLYFYCGIRKGEGRALTWKDIDFDKGELKINKTINEKNIIGPPKTNSSYRTIPIKKQLLKELEDLQGTYSWDIDYSEDNYIFGGVTPVTRYCLESNLKKYCELANVKRITMHQFRHSCASMLISIGMNPAIVSKYLGHATISQTMDTYTHVSEQDNISLRNTLDTI